jgi:hypothetical protein
MSFQTQLSLSRQKQSLALHYDMLGRLLESAENYAIKANNETNLKAKYKYYDAFQNSDLKTVKQLKKELISSIEFFQCGILRYIRKYKKFELPPNEKEIFDDLKKWKSLFDKKGTRDSKIYDDIAKILKNKYKGLYECSDEEEESEEEEKNNKNDDAMDIDDCEEEKQKKRRKNGKKAEMWSTLGPKINENVDNRVKQIEENIKNNPNYKPELVMNSNNGGEKDLIKGKKELDLKNQIDEDFLKLIKNAKKFDEKFIKYYYDLNINERFEKYNKELIKFNNKYKEILLNPEYRFPLSFDEKKEKKIFESLLKKYKEYNDKRYQNYYAQILEFFQ